MIYDTLSRADIDGLPPNKAVEVLTQLLAERATITGNGTILRWSEFNENPDLLINELLARILVANIPKSLLGTRAWQEMTIFSIENSAAYLSTALAYELCDVAGLARPVRLVRARKVGGGSFASPAMGEHVFETTVTPITAGGKSRILRSSVTDLHDMDSVSLVLVVDDFKATGSTLSGGVLLAQQMFGMDTDILPMAALGKPQQETEHFDFGSRVLPVMTALDVAFWVNKRAGSVMLAVNNGAPVEMVRAQVW
jgi:adenine/guanine phosphoribosyltransferase-like PRPP-binding protein